MHLNMMLESTHQQSVTIWTIDNMGNDLITLTLVKIKTKQHIFFLAYETNSSLHRKTKGTKKTPQTNKRTDYTAAWQWSVIQVLSRSCLC